MSWKLVTRASKDAVETALDRRDERFDWDEGMVLAAYEIDPERPDYWQLDAYTEDEPTDAQRRALKSLFDAPVPRVAAERLPDTDWVSESQKGVDPIRAGRFFVHTPDHEASEQPGVRSFCIPAAQAFGTGQHATTAGCLEMLQAMKRSGVVARSIADIGTGTGLLAFAAMDLWPHADATASDIDPVCLPATCDNAEANGIKLGTWPGQLAMTIADGMDDEMLQARAPFDLFIANILAAPLIAMAPDFAAAVSPRGYVLLAGLLEMQERAVRQAWRREGFRLHKRLVKGDWSILWLRARSVG